MTLIDRLIKDGYLKSPAIIDAFKTIRREDFVVPGQEDLSQVNSPLAIGYDQTISQPATVAFMMELLSPQPGDKVLDVGSGSGWTTALLAHLVGANGKVFGLEIIKELKEFGEANVSKYKFIDKKVVTMFNQNGYDGLPGEAPFDKILVSAAAEHIPHKLVSQLKIGGRMVIPVGERFMTQDLVVVDKEGHGGKKTETRYPGFIFVPLINPHDSL